jgi:hypothetical protein
MAVRNPVLYSYIYKRGGARGAALAAAVIPRFFRNLIECDAEAVIPLRASGRGSTPKRYARTAGCFSPSSSMHSASTALARALVPST